MMNGIQFVPDTLPRFVRETQSAGLLIAFYGRSVLVTENHLPLISEAQSLLKLAPLKIGTIDGAPCYTVQFTSPAVPEGFVFQDLRAFMDSSTSALRVAIARGRELLFWRSLHKFCGTCGTRMTESDGDISMVCPECGTHYFPQIAPAVIVLVRRGQEILLAHNRSFRNNIYGLVAGFVEAGESLEQAVERELFEETQIRVKNIRYFGSQTWPYPNSLMIGFIADYDSGTVQADGTEIEKAGWFTRNHLPEIPLPGSIARRMIDSWLNSNQL